MYYITSSNFEFFIVEPFGTCKLYNTTYNICKVNGNTCLIFFFVPYSSYVEINAFPWENGERFHQVFVPVKKNLPSSFVVPMYY